MKLTVFIDGAVEPYNPGGTGACAFAVFPGDVGGRKDDPRPPPIKTAAKLIGAGRDMTNNVAEYRALRGTLSWLLANTGSGEEIAIRMDSKLVVCQMNDTWACNAAHLQAFRQECRDLVLQFQSRGTVLSLTWVPREENYVPDHLINLLYAENGIHVTVRQHRPPKKSQPDLFDESRAGVGDDE